MLILILLAICLCISEYWDSVVILWGCADTAKSHKLNVELFLSLGACPVYVHLGDYEAS